MEKGKQNTSNGVLSHILSRMAWTTLLWCNGRVALPDHERLIDWLWHPAPLSEWDGIRRRRER
jgi:hypothetical protein